MADRGPLRFIILATTGEDIGKCTGCEGCYFDEALLTGFDVPVWEVMAAARENDEAALTNQTIWTLTDARTADVRCPNGLKLVVIAQSLCREARLRGLAGDVRREAWSVEREAQNVSRDTQHEIGFRGELYAYLGGYIRGIWRAARGQYQGPWPLRLDD